MRLAKKKKKKKKIKRKFIYLALLRKRFALFNSAQEIGEAEAESWQLPISLTCLHNQLSSLRSTDAHKVLQMFKQGDLSNDQKYDVCIFAANFTEKWELVFNLTQKHPELQRFQSMINENIVLSSAKLCLCCLN